MIDRNNDTKTNLYKNEVLDSHYKIVHNYAIKKYKIEKEFTMMEIYKNNENSKMILSFIILIIYKLN